MVVVFAFLRRLTPTIAAGVIGAAGAGRHLRRRCGSPASPINNLTLMALAISVGFVVDDAIVMIENMYRNLEQGMKPFAGGARGRPADRLHGAVDQSVADRRLHAADLHGRGRRPAAARVLADPDFRHRGFDGGVADGHADDLRALHQVGDFSPRHLVRPRRRRHAVAHRFLLYANAAGGAGLPDPDPDRVFRDHRADDGALCQDPEGLFPGRRHRLRDRLDPGVGRYLVPVHAEAAAAARRYRDGRSGRGRDRIGAGRRLGRQGLQSRGDVSSA